jgi:hypothetical protein
MLTQGAGTQSTQQQLLAEGVDPRSSVNNNLSENVPVLTVTGVGTTAAEAVHSGRVLGQTLTNELNSIQARLSVSPGYRITVYPLQVPEQASLKLSSKLRDLIGVLALGMILMWVCISVAVARAERKKTNASSADLPDPPQWPHGGSPVSGRGKAGVDGAGNGNGNGTDHSLGQSPRVFVRHRE